jgi:hypothetical protein
MGKGKSGLFKSDKHVYFNENYTSSMYMILHTLDLEKGLLSLHFPGYQIGYDVHRISNWDCWISAAFTSVCGSILKVMVINVAWTHMRT